MFLSSTDIFSNPTIFSCSINVSKVYEPLFILSDQYERSLELNNEISAKHLNKISFNYLWCWFTQVDVKKQWHEYVKEFRMIQKTEAFVFFYIFQNKKTLKLRGVFQEWLVCNRKYKKAQIDRSIASFDEFPKSKNARLYYSNCRSCNF